MNTLTIAYSYGKEVNGFLYSDERVFKVMVYLMGDAAHVSIEDIRHPRVVDFIEDNFGDAISSLLTIDVENIEWTNI